MPGSLVGVALLGAGLALVVVLGFAAAGPGDRGDGDWEPAVVVALLAGSGLFLVAVILQVRRAMAAARRLRSAAGPVLAVTAAFVGSATAVFGAAFAGTELLGGERDPFGTEAAGLSWLELAFWWWPLLPGGVVVVLVTDALRRRVARSAAIRAAASRRSLDAGGNGSG